MDYDIRCGSGEGELLAGIESSEVSHRTGGLTMTRHSVSHALFMAS